MKLKSLSIFFPCFNDLQTLPALVSKSRKAASQLTSDFEVIIVDDGSGEETIKMLAKLKKNYPRLRISRHPKNLGYGAALRTGFKTARKEWIFYTDGDGQYDPGELLLLAKNLGKKTDIVNGYKLKRADSLARRIIGVFYNLPLRKIYKLPISDIDCDFRLIRRSSLEKIDLSLNSGAICLELIVKLQKSGARFKEVGVHHFPRLIGKSQFFRPKNIFRVIKDNMFFYLHNFSKRNG